MEEGWEEWVKYEIHKTGVHRILVYFGTTGSWLMFGWEDGEVGIFIGVVGRWMGCGV